MRRKLRQLGSVLLGGALAVSAMQSAHGALRINEMMVNAPGGGDDGFEYIEISGGPNESVAGVWLLVIDNEGSDIGVVSHAVDLTASGTVGTNGLLMIRDAATALSPAPAGATTIVINNFTPDLDNDHHTYALVTGFTGAVTNDLDTNDDGSLDTTPWTGVLDALSLSNAGGEPDIATGLGGTLVDGGLFTPDFTPDALFRNPNNPAEVIGFDVLGTNPGPYSVDPTNLSDPLFSGVVLSPGNTNDAGTIGSSIAFNELFLNAPGGGDNGFEYVELRGNNGESVSGVTLVVIDNNGGTIGTIESAIDLTPSVSLGENGLLLVRDSATVLSPAPAAQTRLQVSDFAPDLANDSITFLLVTGYSGSILQDLDTNDDATLETTPWTAILDALMISDPDGEPSIADPLGGRSTLPQTFTPDAVMETQVGNTLIVGDVTGTNPGPYAYDATEIDPTEFAGEELTPGLPNPFGGAGLPATKVPFFTTHR